MQRGLVGLAFVACLSSTGCAYQVLEPGHRGLRFEPQEGLHHEVLQPGKHNLGWCFLRDCGRIDDFDVTYSTQREEIITSSSEGLALDLRLAVIFRPVVSELYELDSEVGPNFYEEVVGPEFRSASRGVFARHSYTELAVKNEKIEDEIEAEVRRRTRGKHVEIASITLEQIGYAPEIAKAVRERIIGEQEAVRQKAAMENDAIRQRLSLEQEAAKTKLRIENAQAETRMQTELELQKKKNERAVAEEQAALEKANAQALLAHSRAEAESIAILARAHAEENRAQTLTLSPLSVQMAAYEALGKLGGTGTTIMLGDFSRAPQFLFPPGLALTPRGYAPMPAMAHGPSPTPPTLTP